MADQGFTHKLCYGFQLDDNHDFSDDIPTMTRKHLWGQTLLLIKQRQNLEEGQPIPMIDQKFWFQVRHFAKMQEKFDHMSHLMFYINQNL